MADEKEGGSYGYTEDEIRVNPFDFGLNAGKTYLKKFEWTPTGGKDGAQLEALDIIFTINGTDKSTRKFPITEAFIKNSKEKTSDPNSPEMIEAHKDFNAIISHIMHIFVDDERYKSTLSRKISSFREFCEIVAGMLPKGFDKIPLDIFLHYQWEPSKGQKKTYLEIPNKMSQGRWLSLAQPGEWVEHRKTENLKETDRDALYYENERGERHPFVRSGYFLLQPWARQQGVEPRKDNTSTGSTTSNEATAKKPDERPKANWA